MLSKGHTVETCRTDLVGEYIGHTENRMKEVLEQARGGVLFIDEAYTLVGRSKESNDFGKEVIHALLPILSEPDPDLIVILAGYEEKMQTLLQSNPGLKDRFPLKFYFEDYTNDELYAIACQTLQEREFVLTPAAEQRLRAAIARATAHRDIHFGNGRWVHNLVEQGIVKSMARRIMSMPGHDRTDRALLSTVEAADIDEADMENEVRAEECGFGSSLHRALLAYGDYSVPSPRSGVITYFVYSETHHNYDWLGAFRKKDGAFSKAVDCLKSLLDKYWDEGGKNDFVFDSFAVWLNGFLEDTKLPESEVKDFQDKFRRRLYGKPNYFKYICRNYYVGVFDGQYELMRLKIRRDGAFYSVSL